MCAYLLYIWRLRLGPPRHYGLQTSVARNIHRESMNHSTSMSPIHHKSTVREVSALLRNLMCTLLLRGLLLRFSGSGCGSPKNFIKIGRRVRHCSKKLLSYRGHATCGPSEQIWRRFQPGSSGKSIREEASHSDEILVGFPDENTSQPLGCQVCSEEESFEGLRYVVTSKTNSSRKFHRMTASEAVEFRPTQSRPLLRHRLSKNDTMTWIRV